MRPGAVRSLGAVLLVGDAVLLLAALYLAFQIEPTHEAIEKAAKGQAVGVPAFASAVGCVVAMVGARRRWATVALAAAAVLAVVALSVLLLRQVPNVG